MKVYVLNATVNGYLATDILVNNMHINGIISLDSSNGRNVNEYYDYKPYCAQYGLEYISVQSYAIKSEADRKKLSGLKIDLLIVLGWQRLIPDWLIQQCSIGVLGSHGSPWGIENGRGRSPQNWALILGEPKFYLSLFWIEEGIDSGKVIDTRCFDYSDIDDIDSSYIKSNMLNAEMILENVKNNRILKKEGIVQNGSPQYLPKRVFEDGFIDWSRKGKNIYNFVRALTKPYPGAYTKYNGAVIYIWRVRYIDVAIEAWGCGKMGEVMAKLPGDKLIVKCGRGYISIDEYSMDEEIVIKQGDVFDSVNFKEQISKIVERHYEQNGGPVNKKVLECD